MARVPKVEISVIRRILEEQDIFCSKELDKPEYGLYRYACDFDTKGEQKSSIGVEWLRMKFVDGKDPHLEPVKDYDYTYMESVIVVPRTKEGFCPRPLEEKNENHLSTKVENNKIKYRFLHDTPSSCYHHFEGQDIQLEEITGFIKKIRDLRKYY